MNGENRENQGTEGTSRTHLWLSVLGTVLVICGTILANTCNYQPLSVIPALLSRIDDRDSAWSKLMDYDTFSDQLGEQTRISDDTWGFDCLVVLLVRHGRISNVAEVVGLSVEEQMLYGDETQTIGQYVLRARYKGEMKSRVVAWVEDVSGWIEAEKLSWAITTGFPVLSLGLLLSLVALAFSGRPHLRRNGRAKRASPLALGLVASGAITIALFLFFVRSASLLADMSSLAVVLTLLILIRYAYDTFRMAEVTSTPSASLGFINNPHDANPLLLRSLPRNYSRIPLELWCEVRITLLGHSVELERFYGGQTPWYLQPYQKPVGILDLSRIIKEEGKREEDLHKAWESATDPDEKHRVLRLDVKFSYSSLDGRFTSPPFLEGYYYNPAKRALVLDPHISQDID